MKRIIQNKIIKLIISITLVIVLAYLLSIKFFRIDLTSEGRYTLSDYTKSLMQNLENTVLIKVYLDGNDLPIEFKKMRQAIKEQLEELKAYGGENIQFVFENPSSNPNPKIRNGVYKYLKKHNLLPVEINEITDEGNTSVKRIFPGAIITVGEKNTTVNLLKSSFGLDPQSEENINNSIQSLEYEFTNAIQKLTRKNKQKIAIIEGHGELGEYSLSSATHVLMEYYDVKIGQIRGKPGVLNDFKAIIIAKPQKRFSEQDKFVIDQYIMKGGNVLWLVEGTVTNLDSLFMSSYTIPLAQDINLNDQLFKYGARVNHDLIMDKQSAAIGLPDSRGQVKLYPWYYFPVILSDNNHSVSKYLSPIRTEFTCTVDTVGEDPEIKKTILLKTSKFTKFALVQDKITLQNVNYMPKDSELKSGRKNVAVLLEGKFKSIFKNRPLSKYFPEMPNLKIIEKGKPAKMIVVGDGDIIKNDVDSKGKPYKLGYDAKFSKQFFKGNSEFILNAINYLCDDRGLMTIRSRELKMRLLDRKKIVNNRTLIQVVNIVIPVLLFIVFGIIIGIIRRIKYKK